MSGVDSDGNRAFAAILYAEPGSLGLLANVLSAFVVAMQNFLPGTDMEPAAYLMAGFHLILIGGVVQLIAGFLSFRRNDHLSGTAFLSFAALWTAQGILKVLTPQFAANLWFRPSVLTGMVGFCVVAVVLFGAGLTVNYLMPPVLVAMFISLVFESVGLYYPWALYVAGAFEMLIVIAGIYGACASMLRGISQRYVWPGFGNALVNVLLIKTKTAPRSKMEVKKNTKYAEPMALGYLCNLIPSAILAFYSLGFASAYQLSFVWVLAVLPCQMFASFYAYLRDDMYHAATFMSYLAVWLGKLGTEFIFAPNPIFTPAVEWTPSLFGVWAMFFVMVVITIVSLSRDVVSFVVNLSFLVLLVLGYESIPSPVYGYTFGVANVIVFCVSSYAAVSSLINSIAEKPVIPVGWEIVSLDSLVTGLLKLRCMTTEQLNKHVKTKSEIPQVLSLTSLAVCSLYGATCDVTSGYAALSWILGSGVILQLYAARCAYGSGNMTRTYISSVFALFWAAWAYKIITGAATPLMTSVILVVLGAFVVFASAAFSVVWLLTSLLMELNIVCLLIMSIGVYPQYLALVSMMGTSFVAFYGAVALFLNSTCDLDILPIGSPIFAIKSKMLARKQEAETASPPCPLYSSNLTSGLRGMADLLDQGAVTGIPTDTVYALAASCKHPDSIERLYKIKERPAEKPICLCLSSLEQLKDTNPDFSPLLWRFMRNCYPGGISCVVPKGEWLKRLGVGEAASYVGTPASVCIRVPDSTVVSHLVAMTGPIAITSANPSGEPDSTHHDMVIDRLGHKLGGVLCDGPSNHSVASTVVSCAKIDEGVLTYFRIGCVPKEVVEAVFEKTKREMAADAAA